MLEHGRPPGQMEHRLERMGHRMELELNERMEQGHKPGLMVHMLELVLRKTGQVLHKTELTEHKLERVLVRNHHSPYSRQPPPPSTKR